VSIVAAKPRDSSRGFLGLGSVCQDAAVRRSNRPVPRRYEGRRSPRATEGGRRDQRESKVRHGCVPRDGVPMAATRDSIVATALDVRYDALSSRV
jgi:hypothetical protein